MAVIGSLPSEPARSITGIRASQCGTDGAAVERDYACRPVRDRWTVCVPSTCAGSLDRARAVDRDVGALAGRVTTVVSVLACHPRFSVVECGRPVAFDPKQHRRQSGRNARCGGDPNGKTPSLSTSFDTSQFMARAAPRSCPMSATSGSSLVATAMDDLDNSAVTTRTGWRRFARSDRRARRRDS